MKKILLALFLYTLTNGVLIAQQDKIVGIYWTPKKDGKIEIYKKSNLYFGKIIAANKPKMDSKNPNEKLRNRSTLGMDIFLHFIFESGKYVNGEIYNPEDGKTYNSKMWLEDDNLKLRGFIGFEIFGQTETLEKVK